MPLTLHLQVTVLFVVFSPFYKKCKMEAIKTAWLQYSLGYFFVLWYTHFLLYWLLSFTDMISKWVYLITLIRKMTTRYCSYNHCFWLFLWWTSPTISIQEKLWHLILSPNIDIEVFQKFLNIKLTIRKLMKKTNSNYRKKIKKII